MMTQPPAEEAFAPQQPKPVENCVLCGHLAVQRRLAQANGNASQVTDLNVRFRRHQRDAHKWLVEPTIG